VIGLNRSGLIYARKKSLLKFRAQFQRLTELADLMGKGMSGHNQFEMNTAKLFKADLNTLNSEVLDLSSEFLAMKRQFAQHWASEIIRKRPEMMDALHPMLSFRTAMTELALAIPSTARKEIAKRTVEKFEDDMKRRESFSVESEAREQKEEYYLKQRLIERIVIHNFKAIHDLELTFPPVPPEEKVSWLLLLGENATGKTSVLQAVSLALMGEKIRKRLPLKATDFVRRGCQSGYVKIFLTNTPEPLELRFSKDADDFEVVPPDQARPKVLSTAYGATRLLPRDGVRKQLAYKASKPFNLFDPFTPLINADKWLYNLSDEITDEKKISPFQLIARDIKTLLMLKGKDRLYKGEDGNIKVRLFSEEVEIEQLSEGYRSVVALATDIMSVMHFRWESMEVAEGIVLVDEIDSHLHPRWKMMLVKRLRKVFPHVQFLATSHDPLSLRGLHKDEVVVMQRDRKHRSTAIKDLPAPDAMRVEQILTSEFFGLSSTIDPEIEEKFDEYYELLALDKPTKAQEERLGELKSDLKGLKQLGDTRRERLMLEAADEFLSKQTKGIGAVEGSQLKASTRKKIAAIWTRRMR
jgi:energy-coupling factor transporter ATP-binding protein EcfA2